MEKPETFLGQVFKPCACHTGSEEYEFLFGCATEVFSLGSSRKLQWLFELSSMEKRKARSFSLFHELCFIRNLVLYQAGK